MSGNPISSQDLVLHFKSKTLIFCATAITNGDIVDGVKDLGNKYEVSTFALHKDLQVVKKIKNIHLK